MGPYGDAITYELIPHIEQLFNGVGEGWGRFLYGGSTGGWESLAVQVFYPNEYNGCFAACPDPIDFRAYTVINLYEDDNAYYHEGSNRKTLRAGMRDGKGINVDEADNSIYTAIAITQILIDSRFKNKLIYLSENDKNIKIREFALKTLNDYYK